MLKKKKGGGEGEWMLRTQRSQFGEAEFFFKSMLYALFLFFSLSLSTPSKTATHPKKKKK